ncbi:CDP-glucose 4,6-dehydratase [Candidatus Magnetobacterium bavaricum]|uniref:CDP-glucose 4,6-dehydratase n=1 Tax=Candidatus Magnetobacterium bavaricum TaxID=29290 RepID=A0A0F3GJM5_9BACT|nr:CDP-glucose 4,6-dehydratase [Candidatus Magnetobacterium bavaricum]
MGILNKIYKDKTVLITGHTGFKGSWLAMWLNLLGAKVIGYSSYMPSEPCNFEVCNIGSRITHVKGDVRDFATLRDVFTEYTPDVIFHLAAQPIVRRSYSEPKLTFDTNIGGTVNILECIRVFPGVMAGVIITSDKCYKNVEWLWGYRETDTLGGDDSYSASKACAELVCHAYAQSFFNNTEINNSTNIASARAGNVIGGGDWAPNRIIPDCLRAWTNSKEAIIRSPDATRPWQHVLEPLSGYLILGAELLVSGSLHGEAFNFGPSEEINKSVRDLINSFIKYWGNGSWKYEPSESNKKESTLLNLSCDKAAAILKWRPVLSFDETIRLTAEWFKAYYTGNEDMYDFSINHIQYYTDKAKEQSLPWVGEKFE